MAISTMSLSRSSYSASFKPSQLEVDYDINITALYEAICNSDWDQAIDAVHKDPKEAKTWVVRHYEDEEGDNGEREMMWRFLPIHSACARDPPASVISALLKAYPDGAHCVDDQGMYPLHYACGNQASREVIRLLLVANSMAARCQDPRGMLPIHYLACWGPSSVSIIDMVLVANRDVGQAKDSDGNTPLDLAMEGEYPERDAVVSALKRWLEKSNLPNRSQGSRAIVAAREPAPSGTTTAMRVAQDDDQETTLSKHLLLVNAAVEDEVVEVNISSSPLSAKENSPEMIKEENDETDSLADKDRVQKETPGREQVSKALPSPQSVSRLREAEKALLDAKWAEKLSLLRSEVSQLKEEKEQSDADWEDKLSLLRDEVTALKEENVRSDAEWEEKLSREIEDVNAKCQDLTEQVEELTMSFNQAQDRVVDLEREAAEKDDAMTVTDTQLAEAYEKIEKYEEETEDLHQTLADVTDERDALEAKMKNLNDRLGSLAASLTSMMERQESLMQTVNDKNAQLMEASQARRENLKILFDMEQEFEETLMSPEADEVSGFEKQMKEMNAISAVIAAMRD